jgi:ammonia channel protein AmtB
MRITDTSTAKLRSPSHGIEDTVGIFGIVGIAGKLGIILLAFLDTFVAIVFIEFVTPSGKMLFIDLMPVFWDIFSDRQND